MIWPQFRFYRATGLPVYATSLIYSGNADPELNAIRFCDMPWVVQAQGDAAGLRAEFIDFASLKSQPRMFALGYDSYQLVALIQAGKLQAGKLQAGGAYPGATGNLQMAAGGNISRGLSCVQIRDSELRPLESAAAK
jgi:outer membrane PBP1 activator LpoA protein